MGDPVQRMSVYPPVVIARAVLFRECLCMALLTIACVADYCGSFVFVSLFFACFEVLVYFFYTVVVHDEVSL